MLRTSNCVSLTPRKLTQSYRRNYSEHSKSTQTEKVKYTFGEITRVIPKDRVNTTHSIREHHGSDVSYHKPHLPDMVCYVEDETEMQHIARTCTTASMPMIPFGVGTSVEGHITAPYGGVCIDTSRMNRVLKVNAEDMDVVVQPGVTREELNHYIRDTGLHFPIDPGANASIGGMASTRASGTNAVRYGTMRDNVLGLRAVLPDGGLLGTGTRARKSAAGYDLTGMLVGSEGTLAMLSEVTLRLHGIPESVSAAVCDFETVEEAAETVMMIIQAGVPIARVEILDEVCIKAVNQYSHLNYPEKPTLFFEFHGSPASVREQAETVETIVSDITGTSSSSSSSSSSNISNQDNDHHRNRFIWATQPEDRTRLWQARHNAWFASLALRPGTKGLATDVCVPISRLAECIAETKADFQTVASWLPATLVGHVGDGNFHMIVMMDPEEPREVAKAQELNDRLVERALAMEGTCTGEHGVGVGKMGYMAKEHGETAVTVMRAMKRGFDPLNIMNPGKIFPVAE